MDKIVEKILMIMKKTIECNVQNFLILSKNLKEKYTQWMLEATAQKSFWSSIFQLRTMRV